MKRVITYGTFELLHYVHINLLRRAKALGDYLVVAISTDEFNLKEKQKKSYFSYEQRKELLESIRYVDLVIPETVWNQKKTDVIKHQIDTFVMGDDWQEKFDFLMDEGIKVVYLPRTPEISTTQIKNDLNKKFNYGVSFVIENQKNKNNRLAGTVLNYINTFISVALVLLFTPFLLRSLGKSEYGVFTLANSIISFLSILDLGLGSALIRYTARARADGKDEKNLNGAFLKLYSIIAIIALIIGIIISVNIENIFSSSFSVSELQILHKVFYVLLVNTVISFPASVFSSLIASHEKFIFSGILSIASKLLTYLANFIFLYFGYKSYTIALVSLCVNCIVWIVNIIYCKSKINIKFSFEKIDKDFYFDLFKYSFFVLLNIVIDMLYSSTDNIILGKIFGSTAVAVYGIGATFQSYFLNMSTAISSVYFPLISKLSVLKDGIKEMSNLFLKVGRIQIIILLYIFFVFFAFGKEFIFLWAGPGFEESYNIAIIIMAPSIIPLSQNIGISILRAINKHSVRSIMYLIIAVFNVMISIPLAYMCKGIGAAIGTAIGNLLGQIIFMNLYYKKIGLSINEYWKQLFSIFFKMFPILSVFFLSRFISISGWSGLVFEIMISQLITLPYCYLIILDKEEKKKLSSIIKKIIKSDVR